MNVEKIIENKGQLQALTSLYPSEFQELLSVFAPRFEQTYKHFKVNSQRRKKPLTARQVLAPTRTLPRVEDKLLFILCHFKLNTTQFAQGALFDLSQGQVSRWVKYLSPILQQAIVDLHVQPARTMDELIRLFRHRQRVDSPLPKPPAQTLHVDATEREISRNTDDTTQKHDYSGKQRMHAIKNSIVSDEYQFIHFVGCTWRGAMHDKAMIAEEIPEWSCAVFREQWLTKDAGYAAYQPDGVHLIAPFKAQRNRPLTKFEKEFNGWVARVRVVIENAISGLKRLRNLKDRCRGFRLPKTDLAIDIAAGLHNFRLTRRKTTYAYALSHVRANL